MLASLKAAGSHVWCTSTTIRRQQPCTPLSSNASAGPVLMDCLWLAVGSDCTWARLAE